MENTDYHLLFLTVAAISTGLMASIFFIFSYSLMQAIGKIDSMYAVAALNSINKNVLSSSLIPLLSISSLICGVFLFPTLKNNVQWIRYLYIFCFIVYLIGMRACIFLQNISLNISPMDSDSTDFQSTSTWYTYLRKWVFWNDVRFFASAANSIGFTYIFLWEIGLFPGDFGYLNMRN